VDLHGSACGARWFGCSLAGFVGFFGGPVKFLGGKLGGSHDAGRAQSAHAGRVSDQVLHIEIEVRCADDELRGRVCDGVREPSPFSGWLGLIGALDAMIGSLGQESSMPSAGMRDRVRSAKREGERCS
jgi:hypothetical protein